MSVLVDVHLHGVGAGLDLGADVACVLDVLARLGAGGGGLACGGGVSGGGGGGGGGGLLDGGGLFGAAAEEGEGREGQQEDGGEVHVAP